MADAWIDRGYAFPKNTPLNVYTRPTVGTEEPTVVCAANLVEAVGEEQDAIGAVVALQASSVHNQEREQEASGMAEVPFVVLRLEHFSMARRIGFPDRLYAGCIRELTYHTDPIAPPKKDHKRKAPPTAPPTGQPP